MPADPRPNRATRRASTSPRSPFPVPPSRTGGTPAAPRQWAMRRR
jgi:hypothetical protein